MQDRLTPATISDREAADWLTTAVEGGINYWAEVEMYAWTDDQVNVTLVDLIEKGRYVITSTLPEWKRAILGVAEQFGRGRDLLEDYDAADADAVVQMYLFDEVRYG